MTDVSAAALQLLKEHKTLTPATCTGSQPYAAQMGIIIAPPMPAFYNQPETVDDIINRNVGRVLDLFGLDSGIVKRWSGTSKNEMSDNRDN